MLIIYLEILNYDLRSSHLWTTIAVRKSNNRSSVDIRWHAQQ